MEHKHSDACKYCGIREDAEELKKMTLAIITTKNVKTLLNTTITSGQQFIVVTTSLQ